MDAPSAPVPSPPVEEAPGVLIDLSGKLRGRRRPLYNPSTCLGKSSACDIRLTGNSVAAQHCLIVYAAGRFQLRDLSGQNGTKVNGRRIGCCFLQNGDHVVIGSWKFQIVMTAEPKGKSGDAFSTAGSDSDRQSLRIQAAAVVAQQAALTEFEFALARRKTSLDKQQAQLAAHLEEKRKRLTDMYAQTQKARQSLQRDRDAYERQVEEVRHDLSKGQLDLLREKQAVDRERKRVAKLRTKLQLRYEKLWSRQQQLLHANQTVVADAYDFVEQKQRRLEEEKEALEKACLKYNADVELGRRRLKSEWDKLRRERARVRAEANSWLSALEENETALGRAESALRKQQTKSQTLLRDLLQESDCLDDRIRNQHGRAAAHREEIARLEQQLASLRQQALVDERWDRQSKKWPLALPLPDSQLLEVWLASEPKHPVSTEIGTRDRCFLERLRELGALSNEVEEQRLSLAEQWELLLDVRRRWREEQACASQEMSELAFRLHRHGAALRERQLELNNAKSGLRRWHDDLALMRQRLIGWQSRLRIQDANWRADRDRCRSELQIRAAGLEQQLAALAELRKEWIARRGQEIEALHSDREAAADTRKEYLELCRQCREQIRELQKERRELSAKALALEQYRQKYFTRTRNPAAAQRRLDRLHRRWTKDQADLIEAVEQENLELQAEMQQYAEAYQELEKHIDRKHAVTAQATDRQTDWEEELLRSRHKQQEMSRLVEIMQTQHRRTQQQISDLNNELERIARMLLEEPSPPQIVLHSEEDTDSPPLAKAA